MRLCQSFTRCHQPFGKVPHVSATIMTHDWVRLWAGAGKVSLHTFSLSLRQALHALMLPTARCWQPGLGSCRHYFLFCLKCGSCSISNKIKQRESGIPVVLCSCSRVLAWPRGAQPGAAACVAAHSWWGHGAQAGGRLVLIQPPLRQVWLVVWPVRESSY